MGRRIIILNFDLMNFEWGTGERLKVEGYGREGTGEGGKT